MRSTLNTIRSKLLEIHRVLLAATRVEYEREHGRVTTAGGLLELVMEHPAFSWLRPLSALIARIDEQLDDANSTEDALTQSVAEVHALLTSRRYLEQLHRLPDLMVAHGALRADLRPSAA
jgi:hypothetical protein